MTTEMTDAICSLLAIATAIIAMILAHQAKRSVLASLASRFAEEAAARASSLSLHHSIANACLGGTDFQSPPVTAARTEDSPSESNSSHAAIHRGSSMELTSNYKSTSNNVEKHVA